LVCDCCAGHKKIQGLASSFNHFLSVLAIYSGVIAKQVEKLNNALKMLAAHVNINKCVKMRQNSSKVNKDRSVIEPKQTLDI